MKQNDAHSALDDWEEALMLENAAEARVEDAEAAVHATRGDKSRQAMAIDELADAKRESERTRSMLAAAEVALKELTGGSKKRGRGATGADGKAGSSKEASGDGAEDETSGQQVPDRTEEEGPKGKPKKDAQKGRVFVAKPEAVRIGDFQVGEVYSVVLTVTNCSVSAIPLKQAELPPKLRDCFKVTMNPPARITAGASCPVTVEFTPKTNEDIADSITFPFESGKFDIPVECTTKKCKPSLSVSSLDFSNVSAGGSRTLHCALSNSGALHSSFSVRSVQVSPNDGSQPPFSFPRGGELAPFSETNLELVFAPKVSNTTFTQRLSIDFGDPACMPLELSLQGTSVDLPVFLDNPLVDFKVCCVDELYRESLVVNNRGKTALRVGVELPKDVAREIQAQPSVAFVQAGSSHTISFKFRPSTALLKYRRQDLPKIGQEWRAEGAIEVPGVLSVPGQPLPVPFTVRAQVSETNLQIDPKSIDFGRCPLDSAVSVILKVTNPAIIPQRIGFLNLPGEVKIRPADGYVTIAPHETLALQVILNPHEVGDLCFTLQCATLRKKYEIPCKAVAVSLPVKFRHPILHMAPFAPGGAPQTASVFLENSSATSQFVEIIPPPGSFLRVEPSSAVIPSKQRIRVKVNLWSPLPEAMPKLAVVIPDKLTDAPGAGTGQSPAAQKRQQRRRAAKAKPGKEPAAAGSAASGSTATEQRQEEKPEQPPAAPQEKEEQGPRRYIASATVPSDSVWLVPVYIRGCIDCSLLEVHTSFRQAPFAVTDPAPLDFGKVPAAQHADKTVEVRNLTSSELKITLDPLDDSFAVLQALRPVGPGRSAILKIRFLPKPGQPQYLDTLRFRAGWHAVEVPLKGESVEPTVAVTPGEGRISLGPIMAGVTSTSEVNVHNQSAFPVVVRAELGNIGPSNHSHSNPFTVNPGTGTLAAGESVNLVITFAPDHERELFHDNLAVSIDGSDIRHSLHLEGNCTGLRGMFVISNAEEDGSKRKWTKSDYHSSETFAQERRRGMNFVVILEHQAQSPEPAVGQLVIGNSIPPSDRKPMAGELIVEPLTTAATQEGFSVEWNSKAGLDPGSQRPLAFKYIPPSSALATASGGDVQSEATVRCTMKGGYTASEKTDGMQFTVTLIGRNTK